MFDVVNFPILTEGASSKIPALFAFIIAICLAFCWYQWKMMRAYSSFPSKRLDIYWLLRIMMGRFPKGVTFSHLVFQEALKTANSYREKGVCVAWFVQPRILVFNGNIVKYLMNEADISDKGDIININKLLFGNGLLGSKHDVWKVHRKLLNPAFSLSILKNGLPSLNLYASELVEKIDTITDKPIEDICGILKKASLQSLCDCVFGISLEEGKFHNHSRIMETQDSLAAMFVERLCRPWVYSDFLLPFFKFGKKYLNLIEEVNDYIREMMNELKKEHSQGKKSCGSILTQLHLQDRVFSEKDVRDHIATLWGAGYDTISVTMMWCLYALGHHPEQQEKAYNEVMSIVPEGDISYEDIAGMKYLDCVIKETMRLYSTIPITSKKANRDIQCGQYTIPKGADVFVFIFMLHRDPNVYPEPEKFDPDRFSDSSKIRPWMYTPFGEGYRYCIGKKFAMMEMKVQLAYILRRFKVTSLNKIDDSELVCAIILKPTKPPRLLFENRHSTS